MTLPLFYMASGDREEIRPGGREEIRRGDREEIRLDEDNSRHIVQVLRMGPGEDLLLADGKGNLLTARIKDADKKKCLVSITTRAFYPPPEKKVAIAISPLKNASRFEWFLEKATEIGVREIIPLVTDRTERLHLRTERLQNILVSAMLQSRQVWLPLLHPPASFRDVIGNFNYDRRLIAWLGDPQNNGYPMPDKKPTLILIGPEGDFTPGEAAAALEREFVPVTLGVNRLRTETAGVVAATLLCIGSP
ncbi:MAG TPA: RsmE family RNA methyltransferase [Puia sp.]|nr:RsmE family RNA methyltransferase [Puia sp.]